MAVWSEVTSAEIQNASRIDGNYYLPAYLNNEEILSKVATKPLPQLFSVSDGNHMGVSQYFTEKSECVPYYRGQDINDFFLENANPIRIPNSVYYKPLMRRSHFKEGDVLVSIVGTIGNLSIVTRNVCPATGSCKIAILRTKSEMSPHYLTAFLLSKFGQLQISRNTRGAVQMGLILKDMSRIRIPIFDACLESEVEKLVIASIEANRESKQLYTQAQQLLESELGLDNLEFEKPVGYEASFSDVTNNNRCDANYYQPKYKQLDNIAAKFDVCLVREFSEKLETGQYATNYTETGYPYIRGVDIESNGYLETDSLIKTSKLPAKANNSVKQDDILVTRVGSIGVCGLIEANLSGGLFSDNLIRIRIRDNFKTRISAHCLNLLFNTTYGQMQMVRFSRGSVQQRLNQTQLGQLPIPIIPFNKQMEIESLLISHRKSKHESKQLLEQAKHRVEQLIEEAVTK